MCTILHVRTIQRAKRLWPSHRGSIGSTITYFYFNFIFNVFEIRIFSKNN